MNLLNIKKDYDLIVSLGMSCAPSINLRRNNLRKFSMPLDWMISLSLTDVNRLLINKFQSFMRLENLHKLDETHYWLDDGLPIYAGANDTNVTKAYFIRDSLYNIISVHDFPIIVGADWTMTYPAYKAKLDLRIQRFWDHLTNSRDTLFIRWSANYEQAAELQSILSHLLKNKHFTILILNPVPELQSTKEINWMLENVCALEVPNDMNHYENWDYILRGIRINY